MNPRQRRGLIYLLIAVVVAIATFLTVTRYVASVNSQVGSRVTVYRAKTAISPYTPLSDSVLEPVEVPRRWTSDSSMVSLSSLRGRRIGFRVEAGTVITRDMLIAPSDLNPDEREIAINVNSVTGVAGRVKPGDRVDIYAVFADVPGLPKSVRVLTRNTRVVSIAGKMNISGQSGNGVTETEVIPVTLALTPNDATAVTYAAAFAKEVRLVALPTDTGANRNGEKNEYDASSLGGRAVPEGQR